MKIVGTISDGIRNWRVDLDVDPPQISMTVGDLYTIVVTSFPKAKARDYLRSGKALMSLLDENIKDVNVNQWQKAVDSQSSPYGKKLVKSIISRLYHTAIKNGVKAENLAPYIEFKIPSAKDRLIIDQEAEQKMWEHYTNTSDNVVGCMLIMMYTGMRPCEMREVTANSIKDNIIYDVGHKTAKGRSRPIIIPNKVISVVKNEIRKNNGTLTNLSASAFSRRFRKIRAKLNLSDQLVPYCARHTYATRLAEAGVSPIIITDLMGHTTVNMSYYYTHIRLDAMRSAVELIQ